MAKKIMLNENVLNKKIWWIYW